MRVTRNTERFTIRCTDHELEILQIAMSQLESNPLDHLKTTGHRRSWARRTNSGAFLRIDRDRRPTE